MSASPLKSDTPVPAHQAGVADNVCGKDRRQFALLTGHGSVPPIFTKHRRRPGLPGNLVRKGRLATLASREVTHDEG